MAMLTTRWIANNAVSSAKMRLENDMFLRCRNAGDDGDVNVLKVGNDNVIYFDSLPRMSAIPNHPEEFTNKSYVDGLADAMTSGLNLKREVRVSTESALPPCTYQNGVGGVNATLQADSNGAIGTIDSVTVVVDDRVLVKNQSNAAHNGIYVVTAVGDVGNPWVLTRARDFDSAVKISAGAHTFTVEGTIGSSEGWVLGAVAPVVIGTTGLVWTLFTPAGVVAGEGLTQVGRLVRVNSDDSIQVNADSIQVKRERGLDLSADGISVSVDLSTAGISAGNRVETIRKNVENITLTTGDVSIGFVDLQQLSFRNMVDVFVDGVAMLRGIDYTLSTAGLVTRVTFVGDLLALASAGDRLQITYEYLFYIEPEGGGPIMPLLNFDGLSDPVSDLVFGSSGSSSDLGDSF